MQVFEMIVYLNGHFIRKEEAKLSPDDRGFLFADGAYEAIRSYDGKLFELERHLQRLERSLRELLITGVVKGELTAAINELLLRNDAHSGEKIVYIQVTRGVAERRHSFPDPGIAPTVYISVNPIQSVEEKWIHGARVILVPDIRWERCDIKSIALLPNVLASQAAAEKGADEALFVRDGHITEGTHTSFCGVFNNHLMTHPLNNFILDGITRRAVLDLCHEMSIPVIESPIREDELKNASELMLLGTSFEVMPVVQVDGRRVGKGIPGPVTKSLHGAFRRKIQIR
jgi:D-alanine transaminase